MKILCVHQGYELYGSDKTFIQSVKAFREKYPDAFIHVLLPQGGAIIPFIEPYANKIDYKFLWILRKSTLKSLFGKGSIELIKSTYSAWRLMREYDFTYINTAVVLNFIVASFFSSAARVVHVHEIPTGLGRVLFSGLVAWSRAAVIYNSSATQNAFSVLPWQVETVIPNGVSCPTSKGLVPSKGGVFNILMIGRLNDWKGQDVVVRALQKMDSVQLKSIKLKIVGDVFESQHHFKDDLLTVIADFSLTDTVEVVGFKRNPEEFYQWADVVVVPSKKPEPFGLVAIEAMSYGKCVIAAKHGGLVDIVEHDVTGRLFTPLDVEALSKDISRMYAQREQCTQMGKAGFARFKQLFTEERYMQAISVLPEGCV